MVNNLSANAGLHHDAIIVARGLSPSGCVISAMSGEGANHHGAIILTISSLTSPAMRAHFEKHESGSVDLYLFPEHGKPDQYVRTSGQIMPGKNGSLILKCGDVVSSDSSSSGQEALLERTLLEPGVEILSNSSALASLKHLYHQHVQRLANDLLSGFVEGVHASIDQHLEQAAEIREINRLKDMRTIFRDRKPKLINEFSVKFQAINEHLNPENMQPLQPSELTVLQQPDYEDWLELQAVASHIACTNRLFVLNQLFSQLTSLDINDSANPISPRCLCHCLQYALDRLGIAKTDRRLLYLVFEHNLQEIWGAATDSLIQDLFRGGLHALNMINLPPNWSQRDSGEIAEQKIEIRETEPSSPPVGMEKHAAAQELSSAVPAGISSHSVFQMMSLQRDAAQFYDGWPVTNPKTFERLKHRRTDLVDSLKQHNPSMEAAIRQLVESDAALAETLDDSA